MSSEARFLAFEDWIDSKEHLRSDWVTVARFDKAGVLDDRGIFSALIPETDQNASKILESHEWNIHTEFGQPFFSRNGNEISLDLGDSYINDGIEFQAFAVLRSFHGVYESRVDIIQNFILYHNLYFDYGAKKYLESVKDEVVIEYLSPEYIRIKTIYLKDYLAARNMILVRFHDHRRYVKKDVVQILGKDSEKFTHHDSELHYEIYINDFSHLGSEKQTISRLLGKDLVRPYQEPIHEDYQEIAEKPRQFASFLVKIDSSGNRIESTCNEGELSNYFVNKGTPHFLTPIYFRPEVLQKYYDNPRRYSASAHSVSFLDIWNIPLAINKEGLVHTWLGDLGRIRYEEQLHWKLHNVAPSGGINEEFYRTQLLAEFVESKEPVYLLHKAREQLNKISVDRFGFKIFKDLSEHDSYVVKSIHIPTTNDQKELDDQLIYLSKYLVDSIDKSHLETGVTFKPRNRQEDTHTRFLQEFLIEKFGCSQKEAEQIVNPFRTLQALRSQSAAHVKSRQYFRLFDNLGIQQATNQERFRALINLLTDSISSINLEFKT